MFFYMEFNVGHVVAYYDYQQSTIRHVKCPMRNFLDARGNKATPMTIQKYMNS